MPSSCFSTSVSPGTGTSGGGLDFTRLITLRIDLTRGSMMYIKKMLIAAKDPKSKKE